MKEEYKLYREDLIRIAEIIKDYIETEPHKTRDKDYPVALTAFAKSMLSDDALVGDNDYFERRHGV